jgi:sigma-B regulation protein RsbU (phosphoserine phosphatase)
LLETVRKQAQDAIQRAEKEKRARSEIEIARSVQQRLQGHSARELTTLRYAAQCSPAGEVGGDYYDFFDMGPDHMGFLLADVSGKGIGAALLMAHLQAAFRSRVPQTWDGIAPIVQEVNRVFYESTPVEHYATLFFARYDDRARRLTYVNAGHLAPVIVRASGEAGRLEPTATVVGAFPLWNSGEETVALAPGDTVVVFSDGIVEAGLESGAEFGEQALLHLLRAQRREPVDALVAAVVRQALARDQARHDDLTLLALRGI